MPDALHDYLRKQLTALDDLPNRPGAETLMRGELAATGHEDAEDEEWAAAELAEAAARAEADHEQEASDAILEGEPPADIEVDTGGLPPMRARVRFDAWVARDRDDLETAKQGRVNFLGQAGAPAVTQEELEATLSGARRGLAAWILGGGRRDVPEQEADVTG